jgi:DNA-binding LytR/AlgR family response regulator
MRSYRILIAEDDALISEVLKQYLEELGHQVIGIVSDVYNAIYYLDEQPDLIFLDIRMHGKDIGFDIAKIITSKYQIPYIFLTSFSDKKTVSLAAKYCPSGYLVKPFKKENIYTALEIAVANAKISQLNKLKITDGGKTYFLNANDILYIKTEGNYIDIVSLHRKITIRSSLSKISKLLSDQFKQCHRNYIVNTNKISHKSISYLYINDMEFPLSRTFKKNFE